MMLLSQDQFETLLMALGAHVTGQGEIIAKLPKTADGVPITPGMHVFLPGYVGNGEVMYIGLCGTVLVNDGVVWPESNITVECWSQRSAGTMYSTYKAAEAVHHRAIDSGEAFGRRHTPNRPEGQQQPIAPTE